MGLHLHNTRIILVLYLYLCLQSICTHLLFMCLYQLPALLVQCPKVFVWLLVLYLNLYLQSICICFSCVFNFVAFHVYCILSTPCTALLVQCRRSGIPQTKGWSRICVMHVSCICKVFVLFSSCVLYFVSALLVQCRRSGIPQTKGWDCICVMHVFAKNLFSFWGDHCWRRMLKTALLPQEALV